jgi:ParB-like chromosome segregation protein Spo0J
MQKVVLKELRENPCRDFLVDPIDEAKVDRLAASIKELGFWGGVALRKNEHGNLEIAAGHHRIGAAIAKGIETCQLYVGAFTDEELIRAYATENATQRGDSSTAVAGSVASALRFVAKAILTDNPAAIAITREQELEALKGHLCGSRGIGEPVLTKFLNGIVNQHTVREQLANLKASGDY